MKRTMLVGEAWGAEELRLRKPFQGPSGKELRSQLNEVGITEPYLTNVFNRHPPGNNILAFTGPARGAIPVKPPLVKGKYVRGEFAGELVRLEKEILQFRPDVIVALGATPLWALANVTGIGKYRGYPLKAWTGHSLIATWHPAAVLRAYKLRVQALVDLQKSQRNLEDIPRKVCIPETIADLHTFEKLYFGTGTIACDVETADAQITVAGFAPSPERAIVVPFWTVDGNYWESRGEELAAWQWVTRILRDYKIVGQNFNYDMQRFWQSYGIPVPGVYGDTMLQHHALQPELPKSLEFLGSVYTNVMPWKHLGKTKEDKEL